MMDFQAWLDRKPKGPAPRRRLPRITKKRAKEVRQYNAEIPAFLAANPICGVWLKENGWTKSVDPFQKDGEPGEAWYQNDKAPFRITRAENLVTEFGALRSTQVHHVNKRRGAMLNDKRYWLAVSADNHEWIENNKAKARERGYLLNF